MDFGDPFVSTRHFGAAVAAAFGWLSIIGEPRPVRTLIIDVTNIFFRSAVSCTTVLVLDNDLVN